MHKTMNTKEHWEYNNEKHSLTVKLPNHFRNKIWAEQFGGLYQIIQNENVEELIILGKYLLWVDPIPLMSLIVLIEQSLHLPPNKIKIVLPTPVNTFEVDSKEEQNNIVLKFLNEEGFLDEIHRISIVNNCHTDEQFNALKNEINNLTVTLNYYNCHVLNARFYDADSIIKDEIFYYHINKVIEEIRVNILNKSIPSRHKKYILYRIRQFFSETIKNVHQHAYPGLSKKHFSIYARFRYGMKNDSIDEYKSKLNVLLKNEAQNSSRRASDYRNCILNLRDGCIELFIVDTGIGISKSMGAKNKQFKDDPKIAYDKIIFNRPDRKESFLKNHTKNGGLYVIGQHISATNDFVLFKDNDYWLGCIMPDSKSSGFYERISAPAHVPGCIFQSSFSWHSEGYTNEKWSPIENKDMVDNLFSKYKLKNGNADILNGLSIIDERNKLFTDIKKEIDKEKNEKKGMDINWGRKPVIYLPPKGMTKHLLAFINFPRITEQLTEPNIVIIADIPDEERIIYYEAFNQASYCNTQTTRHLDRVKYVILVSRALSICVFKVNDITGTLTNKRFTTIHEKEMEYDFIFKNIEGMNISILLEALLNHDSLLIWSKIEKDKLKSLFINAFSKEEYEKDEKLNKIYWSENEYLSEYMDFNQIASFAVFSKLFFIGINRILGLLGSNKINFIAMDDLVKNLVCDLNSNYYDTEGDMKIYIGSVFVKGTTLNYSIKNLNSEKYIHCFHNPSLISDTDPQDNIIKLFFWPKKEFINKHFEKIQTDYSRIGHTPALAEGGWQCFRVPRYNEKDNNKSFYYLSPKESYLIWQNPQLGLRLGHFRYGKHVDLIDINIKAFVEKAFLEKSDLALFLVLNFYYALGGTNEEKQILDKEFRKHDEFSYLKDEYKDIALIVYPNHRSNSIIYEKISEVLHPDLTENIIPLNYIRNDNYVTNHIFSPLIFDTIEKRLSGEKKQVLFFDDVVMSGRTRKEAKHLLFSLGANEIKTLAIFDRQRLPFTIPNPSTNKFYARLDIPRLGNNSSKITIALDKAMQFTRLIDSAKTRIIEWSSRWAISDSLNESNSTVIYPISINPLSKRFSTYKENGEYKQIGGNENRILLTNSVGLSIYCIELFCATGRNDLVLKYCKEIDNKNVKIELICSNLLLCGGEFKGYIVSELVRELLLATNYPNTDSYSSLAAITILSLNSVLVKELATTDWVVDNCNKDIQIAFAIMTYDENAVFTDSYNNYLMNTKKLNNQGLINLSDFHRQLYEKRKTHISPIYAIRNKQRPETVRIQALNIALDKLVLHCKYFLLDMADLAATLKQNALECKKFVNLYFKENEYQKEKKKYLPEIESIVMNRIIPDIEKIHSKLFIGTKNKEINKLIKELISGTFTSEVLKDKFENEHININEEKPFDISNEGRKTFEVLESDDMLPLWIPMNATIIKYLGDLIQNMRHGEFTQSDFFPDPFSKEAKDIPRYLFWYSFKYDESSRRTFTILFANKVANGSSTRLYENACKSKYIKYFIDLQLDIQLSYQLNEEKNILITSIQFPII